GGDVLIPNTQTVTFGQSFTLPTPTRTGHTFNSWLHNGNPFTAGTWDIPNDITIVATWTANTYTITFDVNGGNTLNPSTQDVTFDQTYTLPEPTRTGFTFAGWYNGTEFISLTGTWSIASNVTLVASWTANTYTITFDVAGGDALSDQTVTFGQSFTLPTPTRTGHTFNGWLHNGNPFTAGTWNIANDITIVATWTANTYTITFDVAGGDVLIPNTQDVTFGLSFTLPTPTRTGHTFNGWLHNGNPFTAGTWNIPNDITIVATWTANTYTITFDVNGGNTLNPSTQDVTFGLSFTLPTPTRTGHTFDGWLHNGNPFTAGTWDIPNDITLVATWTANTYTITFNVNGGDALIPNTQEVTFGQPFTLPTPTRTGFTFANWRDGATNVPLTGASWNISPDVTLVAAWTANTYTITYNVNGGNALNPATQNVVFGQSYTLPTPTRLEHQFNGWFNGSEEVPQTGIWNIPNNVTLVANWLPLFRLTYVYGLENNILMIDSFTGTAVVNSLSLAFLTDNRMIYAATTNSSNYLIRGLPFSEEVVSLAVSQNRVLIVTELNDLWVSVFQGGILQPFIRSNLSIDVVQVVAGNSHVHLLCTNAQVWTYTQGTSAIALAYSELPVRHILAMTTLTVVVTYCNQVRSIGNITGSINLASSFTGTITGIWIITNQGVIIQTTTAAYGIGSNNNGWLGLGFVGAVQTWRRLPFPAGETIKSAAPLGLDSGTTHGAIFVMESGRTFVAGRQIGILWGQPGHESLTFREIDIFDGINIAQMTWSRRHIIIITDENEVVLYRPTTSAMTVDSISGLEFTQYLLLEGTLITDYIPYRPGYNFLGWYYDLSFTMPMQTTHMPTHHVQVYARWA
ncbi:MAG: InlB B-repeat-containing protein, partial [Erysipelotrichales bacterium]|nr:InlB B-repeat-containing protein [Erysipelotrichales bacterium]